VTPVGTLGGLGPSPPFHHLPLSQSTAEANTRELHWITELGGFLTIHNSPGYSRWEKLVTMDTFVRGHTVVGLYFSADWCQPCKLFTPLLKKLHACRSPDSWPCTDHAQISLIHSPTPPKCSTRAILALINNLGIVYHQYCSSS